MGKKISWRCETTWGGGNSEREKKKKKSKNFGWTAWPTYVFMDGKCKVTFDIQKSEPCKDQATMHFEKGPGSILSEI